MSRVSAGRTTFVAVARHQVTARCTTQACLDMGALLCAPELGLNAVRVALPRLIPIASSSGNQRLNVGAVAVRHEGEIEHTVGRV